MTNQRVLVLLFALTTMAAHASEKRDNSHQPGVLPGVLSFVFAQLPPSTHISATYVYPTYSGSTEIALLTASEQEGWGIRIYGNNRKTGQIELRWRSGKLPPEFGVSSSAHFRMVGADPLHDGENVEFTGCKQHDCPASYAALLYSPSRKRAYQAVVRDGQTIVSPELNKAENKVLRDYLFARVDKMRED